MKKVFAILLLSLAAGAHAGVADVLKAEQEVAVAKAKVKALKAGLSKREKAELAVALAQAKLAATD